MPIFTLESPDGRRIKIEADNQERALEGAQQWYASQVQAENAGDVPEDLSRFAGDVLSGDPDRAAPAVTREQGRQAGLQAGVGRTAGAGLQKGTLANFSDEAAGLAEASGLPVGVPPVLSAPVGAVRMGLDALGITGGDASRNYDKGLERQRGFYEGMTEANPVTSIASQMAGALALPAGAANTAAQGARLGAGMGALAGYGEGEGDDRLASAGVGAALGGALGAGAGALAGRLSRPSAHSTTNEILDAAGRLGIHVPYGVASDSRAIQAATQAARSAPIGGTLVERSVDDFLGGVRGAVDNLAIDVAGRSGGGAAPKAADVGGPIRQRIADVVAGNEADAARQISYAEDIARMAASADDTALRASRANLNRLAPSGATNRTAVGDDLERALEARVAFNREQQAAPYEKLRELIDPDAPVPVTDKLSGALNSVMRQRLAASEGALPRDLVPMADIATNPTGVTFNGLQRARSTLGERIDFEEAQGFSTADLRRAYGAMTQALEHVAGVSARGDGAAARAALKAADEQFGRLSGINRELSAAMRGGNEAFADRLIGYASEKAGGNLEKLKLFSKELPPETMKRVSRLAFDRLGQGAGGEFSEDALARNWARISPPARKILFGEGEQRITKAIERVVSTARGAEASQRLATEATKEATRAANEAAKAANREYLQLLGKSDEQIVDAMLGWASGGGRADIKKLSNMSGIVGPDGMKGLASVAIQRMGQDNKGEFSFALFNKNWSDKQLTQGAKSLLFPDPAVRQSLDDIAKVSARAADAYQRYANKSGTARSAALLGSGAGVAAAPMTTLAATIGTYALAKALSRPATAKAMARWAKAYASAAEAAAKGGATSLASLQALSRQFAATLARELGITVNPSQLAHVTAGQPPAAAEDEIPGNRGVGSR